MKNHIVGYTELHQFTQSVFIKIGCSGPDALQAANVLLAADLSGVDSHGVARLEGYVRLWEAGRINVRPEIKVIHESLSTATIDGDAGLGLVVAPFAMKLAIDKAKTAGTGWVAVRNSNHFGIAGIHAKMALSEDMIGLSMTNASALVAPTFSKERMLGTNPLAVAIPAGEEPPFLADMATTTVANGKLEISQRAGKSVPEGWAQNAEGQASTDAAILQQGGALLPLGSDREHSSHKGYALGSIVDIFSAVLSGAAYGPWAPPFPAYIPLPQDPPGSGLGHFFGAMRIDAFRPAHEFKENMDLWIRRFRNAQPVDPEQKVLIPGDPERLAEEHRKTHGIPLVPKVCQSLQALAQRFDIAGTDFLN